MRVPQSIYIKGLQVMCHIGVPDQERAQAQKLLIDVEFPVSFDTSDAHADDISSTVDYDCIYNLIKKVAAERPRKLIETLAHDIADEALASLSISSIYIHVRKFIYPDAECVGYRLEKIRKS